jgi:hypothetical protein
MQIQREEQNMSSLNGQSSGENILTFDEALLRIPLDEEVIFKL